MPIDKKFIDAEIVHAEATIARAEQQLCSVKGGLAVLRQLRALLDQEAEHAAESTQCPALPAE